MSQDEFDSLPDWASKKRSVVELIKSRKSTLKIVLKVKDDVFFLQKWIDYHSRIVGLENIIIFDNISTLPEMMEVYSKCRDKAIIVRFEGFHNSIHRVNEFPELYSALADSTRYFQFLDCDEFLSCVGDDMRFIRDHRVIEKLENATAPVIPGSWLENVQEFEDRFWWDLAQNHPVANLRSGKPLIGASTNVNGLVNHNRQVESRFFDANTPTNFFVLHLKRLSADQRIKANLRKLNAYKAFPLGVSIEEILAIDPDLLPLGNKKNWIKEIQNFSRIKKSIPSARDNALKKGTLKINSQGGITFSSDEQFDAFQCFLKDPDEFVRQAFTESTRS